MAHAENKMPAERTQVEVGETDVTSVIVEMATGATLTGRVDPPGKASIRLVGQRARGAVGMADSIYVGMLRGHSDANGVWRLDHVPTGKFTLVAATN